MESSREGRGMEGFLDRVGDAFVGLSACGVVPLLASGLVPAVTDALGPLLPLAMIAALVGGLVWLLRVE